MAAEVTELGYVTLGVSNLAAWEEYASQVRGLEVRRGLEDSSQARVWFGTPWHS